eukprot:scaffold106452_cov63-Phaeocystis_antarctica.AAC.2
MMRRLKPANVSAPLCCLYLVRVVLLSLGRLSNEPENIPKKLLCPLFYSTLVPVLFLPTLPAEAHLWSSRRQTAQNTRNGRVVSSERRSPQRLLARLQRLLEQRPRLLQLAHGLQQPARADDRGERVRVAVSHSISVSTFRYLRVTWWLSPRTSAMRATVAASSSLPAAAPPGCACCSRAAMAVILRVITWSFKVSCDTATALPRTASASTRAPVARSRSPMRPIECSVNGWRSPSVSLHPCSASSYSGLASFSWPMACSS